MSPVNHSTYPIPYIRDIWKPDNMWSAHNMFLVCLRPDGVMRIGILVKRMHKQHKTHQIMNIIWETSSDYDRVK
jgi:hypothetical protein